MSYTNNIIARRIPHGLEGAESCGPTQQWDPNFVFNGIKGQCTPKGSPMTAPSVGGSIFSSLMTLFAPVPAVPVYMPPPAAPSSGMSQNTMIALGLGAVGLLALVMISTRK